MTKREAYVELHANSAFSFLEGASQPESLIKAAVQQDMPAMALLDRNGLYGAPRFHIHAKANNVQAHIGAEIAVGDFSSRLQPPAWLPHQGKPEPSRLPLLCTSQAGYGNLCQLITRFKMRQPGKAEGFALERDLHEFNDGLICMTGGEEGPLAAALTRGGMQEGRELLERLQRMYGHESVYVELQRHGLREEEWRNQAAISLAESLGLPVVATNGVRYATQYEREVLDVFTCIRNGTDLQRAGRLLQANSQRHLRGSGDMWDLFADVPEAVENTSLLSKRLSFELDNLGYVFPSYPVPDGECMMIYLRKRVMEGIEQRFKTQLKKKLYKKALMQAEKELKLIDRLGFAGYFLIVWDIVRFCNANDILIQGGGVPQTPLYVMRLALLRSIRLIWICYSKDSSVRIARNGQM